MSSPPKGSFVRQRGVVPGFTPGHEDPSNVAPWSASPSRNANTQTPSLSHLDEEAPMPVHRSSPVQRPSAAMATNATYNPAYDPAFDRAYEGPAKVRRAVSRWTPHELGLLEEGLRLYGPHWADILRHYGTGEVGFMPGRSQVDLKDKARNELKRRERSAEPLGPFSRLKK